MKIKILKCSICNKTFDTKNIKKHLFNVHLNFDLNMFILELINHRINDLNEHEIRLLEKNWKSFNSNTYTTNSYLLKIKVNQFEQIITQLLNKTNINSIDHQYYKLIAFIDNLKEGVVEGSHLKVKIDNALEKINKIYTARLTKQDYYLKTFECSFCKNRIFRNSINDHILKSHFREKSKVIESALMYYKIELTDNQRALLDNIKNRENEKLEQDIITHINARYYSLEKDIISLNGVEYAEMFDTRIKLIRQNLMDFLNNVKFGELEIKKISALYEQLYKINHSLPPKEKFINDHCQKIYITWDDITFDRNKICISANKGFVHPIPLEGSLSILNEIKVEYFRRVYQSDKFKLIIKNGYVRHDLSSGLDKIKDRISEHIQNIKTERIALVENHTSIFTKTSEKSEILDYIQKQTLKNSFLKYPATLLNQQDNVIALIENNNGNEEEALLFIFKRDNKAYLLWENINSKRAAYIFCFDVSTLKVNTFDILKLISNELENKRENLFKGINIKKAYNIDCIFYKSIVHENQNEYKNNLDRIFNLPKDKKGRHYA